MRFLIILLLISNNLIFAQTHKIDSLNSLLSISKDTTKVSVLLSLSKQYAYDNADLARNYAKQADSVARKLNFVKGEIRSQLMLARISNLQYDRIGSKSHIKKGLTLAEKSNDKLFVAEGCYELSRIYHLEYNYDSALLCLDRAYSIYSELNKKLAISSCLSSFGNIHSDMSNYENG